MPAPAASRILLWFALLTAGLAGCGRNDADPQPPEDPAATEAAAPAPSDGGAGAPGQPSAQPLSVADIERWEKGVAGELEAVREAAGRMKSARTGEDSVNAMMGLQEMATLPAGARAAGLDEERYRLVRSTISSAIAALTPPALEGMDTTRMPQDMRDQFRQGRESRLRQMSDLLPEAVVKQLRPRAAELRQKNMELVGARLKGAGA